MDVVVRRYVTRSRPTVLMDMVKIFILINPGISDIAPWLHLSALENSHYSYFSAIENTFD